MRPFCKKIEVVALGFVGFGLLLFFSFYSYDPALSQHFNLHSFLSTNGVFVGLDLNAGSPQTERVLSCFSD